ncbi:MAG: bifunctional hydroxymethylpyrimidine kinase/phosphomethylpyrimidine kinase [candidate division KSB1 bacterium]|nr:bifunctional hydroxymethylpyrimidine kinase/phosphomethylpyrimidine kinase [candidate division KSB1 bacterium]
MSKHYYRALTIAGSDSGGGAGIQADLKTFSALGCYGMSVITALTAQNTVGVTAIHEAPPDFVAAQIDAVLEDIGADAVKIGMLSSPEIIRAVADRLRAWGVGKIVLDPVMTAKSGDKLLRDEAITALKQELLPLATVVTPNLPEAQVLIEETIASRPQMEDAARRIAALGPKSVLLKGGHLADAGSDDYFLEMTVHGMQGTWLSGPRVASRNTHGTGCTLASAIAAFLAKGYSIYESVRRAKQYISEAIACGAEYSLGKGHGPVYHFYRLWPYLQD